METNVASRIRRTATWVDVGEDVRAHNITPLIGATGQAQISLGQIMTLGICGTPDSWRHLAKVIEDAAMELEGQLAEEASERDHQPRERPVPCSVCSTPTWNLSGDCPDHQTQKVGA